MSEKTEKPTHKKLRDAREQGQVAKSKDFTQLVLLMAMFGYSLANADSIIKTLSEAMLVPASLHGMPFREAMAIASAHMVRVLIELTLPYLLIILVLGVGAEMVQTGVLFSFKALAPSGKKLDVVANVKQMFSAKNFLEFLKSLLKVVIISTLVYALLRDSFDPLLKIPMANVFGAGEAMVSLLTTMIIYTTAAYGAIACFDLAYQRYSYIKGLMMSIEEVKQEYKQMEGDPHIKGKRKHLAKELAMEGMTDNTRRASVVVTNPTHFAVAIRYAPDKYPLPIVVAKGANAVAGRIVAIAREEGIPVMQNVPLARALMATAQLNQYIPSELIEPVAEVLRGLEQLVNQREMRL
jgi:type III secretion protein U